MYARVFLFVIVGVLLVAIGYIACASDILDAHEAAAMVGGYGSYFECVSFGFCNAWPTVEPDGARCTPTCSGPSSHSICNGKPQVTPICVTMYYPGPSCGYKYDSGIARGGECKPDSHNILTEVECTASTAVLDAVGLDSGFRC